MAAIVLLSFGVGTATAAFSAMNGIGPHSMPSLACETMLQVSSDPSSYTSASVPSTTELRARVADVYETSYETASDAAGSWSDARDSLDLQPLAPIFAAGALVLLLACARGAARLLAAPRRTAVVACSIIGALFIAGMLSSMFALPTLGIRSIAFAIGVSLVAAKFAASSRQELVRAIV